MRFVRLSCLWIVMAALVMFALANRGLVEIRLLPEVLAGNIGGGVGVALAVPLYLVIFLGVFAGLLIGVLVEWVREHKYRADAARLRRRVARLRTDMRPMKPHTADDTDDVLDLVDRQEAADRYVPPR